MNIWQIIATLVFYIWLFLVLFLLWRHALGGSQRVHHLQMLLSENTAKSVEAAKTAAEAAKIAAQAAERAVALLESSRHA